MTRKALGLGGLLLLAMPEIGAPVWAGPPFRTDDAQPVTYRHWEVYAFSAATHAKNVTIGVLPGLEINYGAAPDLQIHVIAPLAFYDPSGDWTQIGYGDTEFGIKFRFIQEDDVGWRPQVAVYPLVQAPTGNNNRRLGTGHARAFLPLWLQKSFGAWTTYGGGGYWINPGDGNQNYWFFGWQAQRKVTDQIALGGELFYQTAGTTEGADSAGFNLGGNYNLTEHHHLLFSAGRGIRNARDTNEFSYYIGFQWTF